MTTKAWNVDVGGNHHYVELDHGTMANDKEIKVDVQVVEKGLSSDFGSTIPFEIDGAPAELEISMNSEMSWSYALKVDGRVVEQLQAPLHGQIVPRHPSLAAIDGLAH